MTGRNEITAGDRWLNQRLSTSANVSLIYQTEMLSGLFGSFFFLAVSVSTDYSFKRFEDNCEMQKSHSCFDLMRCDRIKSGEKSGNIGVMPGEAEDDLQIMLYSKFYVFSIL